MDLMSRFSALKIPPYAGITRTGSTVDDPSRPLSSLVRTPVVIGLPVQLIAREMNLQHGISLTQFMHRLKNLDHGSKVMHLKSAHASSRFCNDLWSTYAIYVR